MISIFKLGLGKYYFFLVTFGIVIMHTNVCKYLVTNLSEQPKVVVPERSSGKGMSNVYTLTQAELEYKVYNRNYVPALLMHTICA